MNVEPSQNGKPLKGHALRNVHLRERSLRRSESAPPLARLVVQLRAETLGLTRLELSRRSGVSRGTLRDLELGVHTPTRRVLQQLVTFCQRQGVAAERLEELRRLYTGSGDTLKEFIARLELRAGSSRVLAKKVGISHATLWEYRRGNYPLPLTLLRQLCAAVDEATDHAETLWHKAELQRLLQRSYPPALAEFWVLCARKSFAEKHLLQRGLSTATVRRLRYLELTPWQAVADVARLLCRDEAELRNLQTLWEHDERQQRAARGNGFGSGIYRLRKQRGLQRREIADLFGIGGKKPARIIKYIEEDGFYSTQAHPAGLVALLTDDDTERNRLMKLWHDRRRQFHRRHRPETRVELRLAREWYGYELKEMEPILGYSSLEYQKIERGVTSLMDSACERIVHAIHQAGAQRVEQLLRDRQNQEARRRAWQQPASVSQMLELLAQREGGYIPLTRFLKREKLPSIWTGRLRAISLGQEVPPWCVVKQIGQACGIHDLAAVHEDWLERYRLVLEKQLASPLAVELRLLMAQLAPTLRAFSPRLRFNYSVLVRDLQRIDRDQPIKWYHIERILQAADLPTHDPRWSEMRALWSTAAMRVKKPTLEPRRRLTARV